MITLSDIAAACGVSRTTVSRVLSQDPEFSVSNQTRDLILSTAKAMNYDMSQKRRIPGKEGNKGFLKPTGNFCFKSRHFKL